MMEKIILFINRDSTFIDQTGTLLKKAGYAIRTAVDMRGALSILSTCSVGLIICEKQLQDVSGLDLLNFIKKDPLREQTPFMFLVASDDQGEASRAFELGAADYLVHPLDPRILIGRINEVFSSAAPDCMPLDKPVEIFEIEELVPVDVDEIACESLAGDRLSVSAVFVDVSRDGVIWLPGKIESFGRRRLFIETSLFGKSGVSLMARFKMAQGTFVLNGHIKDIAFADFQKPATIEMSTQDEEMWRQIYQHLLDASDQLSVHPTAAAPASQELEKTIVMSPVRAEKTIFRTGPFQPTPVKKPSYDMRFYQSIIGKQMDNYRAITLIGAGSMGGVIQGWDVALEREVALKVISYELSSKDKFREMFIKEARVVSRLNHLNIAQIYYIGTSNDILYYAMEFVDGQTLKDLIARDRTLNIIKGLDYLATVCDALYYVHQNSIVHRDIKPANIMLNAAGAIKIVDFGVAISGNAKTKGDKNMVIGSPLYMSPEQVAGLTLDYRSDIYSVGATFYHVFTGSPPFEDDDFKMIMSQHIEKPLPPVKEKNPKVPTALAKIIEKMMAKDPLERYKDFQCVAEEARALHTRIIERKRQSARQARH